MSKRRKPAEPELPLFDLPLYDDPDGQEALDRVDLQDDSPVLVEEPPAPPPKKKRAKRKKKAPLDAPLLFTEEELVAGAAKMPSPDGESPPAPKKSVKRGRGKGSSAARSSADGALADQDLAGRESDGLAFDPLPGDSETLEQDLPEEEGVLPQDRLLGGLADLTIHLATLGLMIVAVQLMGVPVAWADWPAFGGLTVIFSFLYSVIPLAFWGHTPGMAWVGHTARSETDEPLSFGQTALRWTGAVFTVFLLGLPLLLAFSGRSLADRISDSKTLPLQQD